VLKDALESDSLSGRHKYFGYEIFGLLANFLQLGNCIIETVLSREYFAALTAFNISLSLSPSKGGAAERRI
jgi:hypothetical protein